MAERLRSVGEARGVYHHLVGDGGGHAGLGSDVAVAHDRLHTQGRWWGTGSGGDGIHIHGI